MIVFREFVYWLYKLINKSIYTCEIYRQRSIMVNFDVVTNFLFVGRNKLQSISYIELLRNWQHNITRNYIKYSASILPNESEIKIMSDTQINDNSDFQEHISKTSLYPNCVHHCDLTADTMDLLQKDNIENISTSVVEGCKDSMSAVTRLIKLSISDDEDISDESSNFSSDDTINYVNNISSSCHHLFPSDTSIDENSNDLDAENDVSEGEISDDDDIIFVSEDEQNLNSSKRVRFKSQTSLYDVDSRWSDDDLMEARIGTWEECARDRIRFRRRFIETEKQIAWIFTDHHRDKILSYIRNKDDLG